MAFYSRVLRRNDTSLSDFWAKKALESNDNFAIGTCYYSALGAEAVDNEKVNYLLQLIFVSILG